MNGIPEDAARREHPADQEEAASALEAWRRRNGEHLAERDRLVRAARALGVNVRQIGLKTGLSRNTVYKITGETEQEREA